MSLRAPFAAGLLMALTNISAAPVSNDLIAGPQRGIQVHSAWIDAPATVYAARPAAQSASPQGHIPCDVAGAYYASGTGLTGNGVTIAIIGIEDQSTIVSDYAAFSTHFGLPSNNLHVFKEGVDFGSVAVPPADAVWHHETSLDVEWAHAMAPSATIDLVEAASNNSLDFLPGVDYAVNTLHADIVSMSFRLAENQITVPNFVSDSDAHFPATGSGGQPVAYVAPAGDNFFGPSWPALSARVIAVGGTSLSAAAFGGLGNLPGSRTDCAGAVNPGVTQANETVWGTGGPAVSLSHLGTGGGTSTSVARPAWQNAGSASGRNTPDVAALADPANGVAVYETVAGSTGWWPNMTGGTSLAGPLWAGFIALADERATSSGIARFNVTSTTNNLYTAPAADFNDIVVGNSPPGGPSDPCIAATTCVAQPGYDLVTGRGSPKVNVLVSWLGGNLPATPYTYYFPWYDNNNSAVLGDNIHIAHGTFATVSIPGYPTRNLVGDGYVAFPKGTVGGPVRVATSQPALVTQRVQFNNSFNEVPAMRDTSASNSLRFTWYDRASSPGFLGDDILVVAPGGHLTPTDLTVTIPGCSPNVTALSASELAYSCPLGSGFGGPVTIESPVIPVLASQRVVYYDTFNEVDAMPSSSASGSLVFTWYDHASSVGFVNDNIHIINPTGALTPAEVNVQIPACSATSWQPSSSELIYSCPFGAGFGGPVTITASVPVLASQRVQYYTSFNEVAAMNPASAAADLNMTWYDHASSGGFVNDNIHIINPTGSLSASQLTVTVPQCPDLRSFQPSASEVIYSCPFGEGFGGPVHIHAAGGLQVLASQRVQYYQSFNEAAAGL